MLFVNVDFSENTETFLITYTYVWLLVTYYNSGYEFTTYFGIIL